MVKKTTKSVFVCNDCGEEYVQWQGRCGNCGQWNTIKEITIAAVARGNGTTQARSLPARLKDISSQNNQRLQSGLVEFDQVLGGGIVPGSVILLGGDPGIGKSTLLLQVVERLAEKAAVGIDLLYVSGEESLAQIKLRAERLGVKANNIQLLAETDIAAIEEITARTPNLALMVIDSIQTMYDGQYPSTPGSIVQVRETALRIQRLAKQLSLPVVLIGHITKEGTVAGPRTLEHLVDVVLYLEGDTERDLRILRGVKNRFGSVNEVGLFAMQNQGMSEVSNPNDYLLNERVTAPGTVLTAVMEGSRPLLVEVQALTSPSNFGYPRRTSSGFDLNRLNLLLAVLQKRASLNLANQDVFINIVGGWKLKDTAVDAAVCLALASAAKGKVLSDKLCVIGEVGLAGEIRAVSQESRRVAEIEKLGYSVPAKKRDIAALIRDNLGA